MTSKNPVCGGCLRAIRDRRFLRCCVCRQNYDLECAGVSEQRFRNTLTDKHREAWKCVSCISKLPKTDNSNTPVRSDGGCINTQRGASVLSPPEQLDESSVAIPTPLCNRDIPLNTEVEMTDIQQLIHEVRLFREEMSATRHQMKLLSDNMATLSARIGVCECRIDTLSERVATLEGCADGGAENKNPLLVAIEQLKAELNDRDQDLLDNDVEIACVPETKGESLPHIIMTLSTKLGLNLTEQDFVSASRVGRIVDLQNNPATPPRPRLIVARFTRRAVRDQLLREARVRRGATTEGIGLPGPPRRFYINERLTRFNRLLFRSARQLGEERNWRFVWTRNGKIFARQHQGADAPRHRLRAESDLSRVFGSSVVRAP